MEGFHIENDKRGDKMLKMTRGGDKMCELGRSFHSGVIFVFGDYYN